MVPNIVKGGGITGAIGYAMGEGNDKETGKRKELEEGQASRAELLGGQGFGFDVNDAERLELARKVMEWSALPENQASPTKKCVKDCLHMTLSWDGGQEPQKDEMIRASQEALKALGMENARAVFIAHNDTEHAHVHIIASRINPETGRAFSDTNDMKTAQAWGLRWERENNQVSASRGELHSIVDAVLSRDKAAILDHMTERQSTFTAKDLDKALGYGLPDQGERAKFRLEVLADKQVIGLRDTADSAVTRYTTRDVLTAERSITRAAEQMEARQDHDVSARRVDRVADRATLNDEQRNALQWATEAGGFAVIAGEAGTGKSRTLGAIRDVYEQSGHRVIGMAWTNAVVQDMRADGFKEATTIAAELKRQEGDRAQKWDKNTVLMVDEAAMLSTKHLAAVMTKADAAGAKVILAGDDKQLASIERGGMFGVLAQEHGAAELKQVQRTKDQDQQRAFNLMHEGEFRPALEIFEKKGAINWTETQQDALRATAEKYAADVAQDASKRRFIFAYTNADVDKLNEFGRGLARHHGQLGDDVKLKTSAGEVAFAKGDRIQFTGNAADRKGKNAGLVNGAVGVVRAIDSKDDRRIMTVELDGKAGDQPRTVKFTVGENRAAGEFNAIRHGYAGTIYKGQGRTLDESYVYHSQHWRAASSYVALTRHRSTVSVFVAREVAADLPELARQMQRNDQKRAASAFVLDPAMRAELDAAAANRNTPQAATMRQVRQQRGGQAVPASRGATGQHAQAGVRTGVNSAAKIGDVGIRAVGAALDALAGLFESLFGGSAAPNPNQHHAPVHALDHGPRIDPAHLSQGEQDQRRAALLQRFGRDMPVEAEQTADREERLKRESGQSYR
jgi:hypothetical protein